MRVSRITAQRGAGFLFLLVTGPLSLVTPVYAATKTFSGGGDGSTWHDEKNWFATGVPGSSDGVTVDKSGVTVEIAKDFLAQSVTVGGKTTSTWTVDPFVYGTIAPASSGDPAILIRKGGTVVMKGAGTVKVKGSFKNSEESLPTEPSVMVVLQ